MKRKTKISQAKMVHAKDDSCLQESSRELDADDHHSLDNNTNLNWCTGKRSMKKRKVPEPKGSPSIRIREKQSPDGEMPTAQFYQSSRFFIDQLLDDICEKKEDGSFEVKKQGDNISFDLKNLEDPFNQAHIRNGKILNLGRWAPDEHQRFLEGLKLYGKNWAKVEKHVGTRSIPTLISHGQKFLEKLLRFINQNEQVVEMSKEDAVYYCGVLQQRKRKPRKPRTKNSPSAEPQPEVQTPIPTAETQNETVSPPAELSISPPVEVEDGPEEAEAEESESVIQSAYQLWQQNLKADRSFHPSLGFSIKFLNSIKGTTRFTVNPASDDEAEDNQSDDSAASQGSNHLRKFYVMDGFLFLRNRHIYQLVVERFDEAMMSIQDLESVDSDVEMFLVLDGRQFQVPLEQPLTASLSQMTSKSKAFKQRLQELPNLRERIKRIQGHCPTEQKGSSLSFWTPGMTLRPEVEYIRHKSEAEIEEILNKEIKFVYRKREEAPAASQAS